MTVAEMIAELQKMGPDWEISIEVGVPEKGTGRNYRPTDVEAFQDGYGKKLVIIWGSGDADDDKSLREWLKEEREACAKLAENAHQVRILGALVPITAGKT